jgi:hypothetical protein
MKVEIGSKYVGPDWSKPSIRQMPKHWVLEETKVSWFKWILLAIYKIIRG